MSNRCEPREALSRRQGGRRYMHGTTIMSQLVPSTSLSVWWSASVWGSAPVWRSASGWATVLLSWLLGGLANNHPDLDYQVRFSHHSASFQAYLCSLSHFLKLATLVQSLSCLAITLINYYFTSKFGTFSPAGMNTFRCLVMHICIVLLHGFITSDRYQFDQLPRSLPPLLPSV